MWTHKDMHTLYTRAYTHMLYASTYPHISIPHVHTHRHTPTPPHPHPHPHPVRERLTRAVLHKGGGSTAHAWNTLWWAGDHEQLYAVAATTTCVLHVGTGAATMVGVVRSCVCDCVFDVQCALYVFCCCKFCIHHNIPLYSYTL